MKRIKIENRAPRLGALMQFLRIAEIKPTEKGDYSRQYELPNEIIRLSAWLGHPLFCNDDPKRLTQKGREFKKTVETVFSLIDPRILEDSSVKQPVRDFSINALMLVSFEGKYTQNQIAKRCGISQPSVSRYIASIKALRRNTPFAGKDDEFLLICEKIIELLYNSRTIPWHGQENHNNLHDYMELFKNGFNNIEDNTKYRLHMYSK